MPAINNLGDAISLVYIYDDPVNGRPTKSNEIGQVIVGDGVVLGLNAARQTLIHFDGNGIKIEFLGAKSFAGRRVEFVFTNTSKAFMADFKIADDSAPIAETLFSTQGNEFRVRLDGMEFTGPAILSFAAFTFLPLETFQYQVGPNGIGDLFQGKIR